MFELARPLDLRNDSATYVRMKLRKKLGQRMEFPLPMVFHDMVREQGTSPDGVVVNGIYCGIFKVGRNPKNPFFRGSTITHDEKPDWRISLRDVIIKDKDGKEGYFIFASRSRRSNKRRLLEFSLNNILAAALSKYTGSLADGSL